MLNRLKYIGTVLSVCVLTAVGMAQTAPVKLLDSPLAEPQLVVSDPGVQDIYLLIGQSNMGGRAAIGELDQVVLQNVFLFNGQDQWEKASNLPAGMNRYSTVRKGISMQKLNPAYTFGRKLAEYTDHKIGIVCNARGGTAIAWWQKGYAGQSDADMYEEAVARTKAALAASPGATLKGIIWHQGEGDNSEAKAAIYMQQLQHLVIDLRADLNAPNVPFIAGEVGTWKGRGQRVNPVIDKIAAEIPHSGFASSEGLTSLNFPKNDPHFDTLSQRVLGERYADKALQLVYGISPGKVTLFSGADYSGRSVVLRIGKYTTNDLEMRGITADELISLKIDKGYKVLLYISNLEILTISENVSNLSVVLPAGKITSIEIVLKR